MLGNLYFGFRLLSFVQGHIAVCLPSFAILDIIGLRWSSSRSHFCANERINGGTALISTMSPTMAPAPTVRAIARMRSTCHPHLNIKWWYKWIHDELVTRECGEDWLNSYIADAALGGALSSKLNGVGTDLFAPMA